MTDGGFDSEDELAAAFYEKAIRPLGYRALPPDGDFRLRLRTPSGETFNWRDSHEFLFGCVYSKFHRWGSAFSLLRDLVFDTLEPPDGMSWQELALVLSAKGIV